MLLKIRLLIDSKLPRLPLYNWNRFFRRWDVLSVQYHIVLQIHCWMPCTDCAPEFCSVIGYIIHESFFARTFSAFNCSLSCENSVSTLRRKRKISCRISFGQLFLWLDGLRDIRQIPFSRISCKGFLSIAFISIQMVFCKVAQSFPVIHRCRRNLKSSYITFYSNEGMYFKPEISFLLDGHFP